MDGEQIENEVIEQQADTATIAGVGKTTRVFEQPILVEETKEETKVADAPKVEEVKTVTVDTKETTVDFSEEQKKAFFKSLGVEYRGEESIEEVKQKLNYKPEVEPTEEEKQARALSEEKELLDLYLTEGQGSIENYSKIKGILSADPYEFALAVKRNELKEKGFSEEDAEDIITNEYYLNAAENLDRDNYDTDEEYEAQKKRLEKLESLGKEKLESTYNFSKKTAETFINNLKEEISNRKQSEVEKANFAAKAKEYLKTLPRTQEIDLGQLDNAELGKVSFNHTEAEISEIEKIVTDPVAINQLLRNDDGTFKVDVITDLLLSKNTKQKLGRESFLAGQTRMTDVVESIYPNSTASALGLSGIRQNVANGDVRGVGQVKRIRSNN